MIARLFNKQIDARGLALFRILYGLVLLGEIGQLYYFRHLVFDPIPYIEPAEIDVSVSLWVWMLAAVCIIFGVFTRSATLVNYVCSLFFIATIRSYEYHMFYAYMGINFLLLFLPVSTAWSLDRLRKKLRYSNTRFQYQPPQTVSALAYLIPVFVAIGLVYMDSVLYKLNDPVWMGGLGMWLPGSLPMITHFNAGWVLNQEWLVKFLGYFTILFEFVFVFMMWGKRFRWFCLIVGLALHVSILLVFPIPFFALGVIAIYLLMLPVGVFAKLARLRKKRPLIQFYYDAECPLCIRTKIVLEHLDIFGAVAFLTVQGHAQNQPLLAKVEPERLYRDVYGVYKGKVYRGLDTYIRVFNAMVYLKPLSWLLRIPGIYHIGRLVYKKIAGERTTERCTEANCGYTPPAVPPRTNNIKLSQTVTVGDVKRWGIIGFLLLVLGAQAFISYNSSLTVRVRKWVGVKSTPPDRYLSDLSDCVEHWGKTFLGLTHHPVFVNGHFQGYNHIIKIKHVRKDGRETRLPIVDEQGMPDLYVYGFNWVKWSFRVNGPNIDPKGLSDGIRSFTAFWAHRHGVTLEDDVFKVYVKKVPVPTDWEKDFLQNQLHNAHWVEAGTAVWKNKHYTSQIQNIESL